MQSAIKTRGWLALMAGLAMMTASLGVAGGAQAATHAAQPAAAGTGCPMTITPNLPPGFPVLFSSGSSLQFSASAKGDPFCITQPVLGGIVTIFDDLNSTQGDCLALNSTTGDIYLHNPNGCGVGSPDYLSWVIDVTANGLWQFQNLWGPGNNCLYDINGAAKYAVCNPNSRADTFLPG